MGTRQDYSGQSFGRITLGEPIPARPGYWRGHCACGNAVEKRLDNLRRLGNHTCGRCAAADPRLTEEEVRAKLATLEEDLHKLRQEILRLSEPLNSVRTVPATPTAITSQEGQAIWSFIEEMKGWLKNEIGVRLKAIEADLAGLKPLGEEVASLHRELARRDEQLAAVRQELKDVQRHISPDQVALADSRSAVSAAAVNGRNTPDTSKAAAQTLKTPSTNSRQGEAHRSDEQTSLPDHTIAVRPVREKIYPVRPGHLLQQDFYYWRTAEGYELETTLGGKKVFLDFHDTTADVQQAISDHLHQKGYMLAVIEDLFEAPASGPDQMPAVGERE